VQNPPPDDPDLKDARAALHHLFGNRDLSVPEDTFELRFQVLVARSVASGGAVGDDDVDGQRLAHGSELSEARSQQIIHAG
jgi:hypothetical protein